MCLNNTVKVNAMQGAWGISPALSPKALSLTNTVKVNAMQGAWGISPAPRKQCL